MMKLHTGKEYDFKTGEVTAIYTEIDAETYRGEQLALLKVHTSEAIMSEVPIHRQINALTEFLSFPTKSAKLRFVQWFCRWLLSDHPAFEKISTIRRKAADIEVQLLNADEETLHAITWEFK